ncbi:MAG TPA: hypothetical protein VLJ76_08470 [Gaiellaceae bacterium]|nr:hypothetical protein [Gaiellaceae bacterium]
MARKKREGDMPEESQIEAMRQALRGDIERARSRNPDVFDRPPPTTAPVAALEPEPAPSNNLLQGTTGPDETVAALELELELAPEPEPVVEPVPAVEPAPEIEPAAEPGFFRRLFGRR